MKETGQNKKSRAGGIKKNLGKLDLKMPKINISLQGNDVVVWLLFILLAVLTTTLVSYRGGKIPTEMKVGQIAPYDIKADRDYEIVDEEATAKFKADALQNIKPIYTFDPFLGAGIADRVKTAMDEMRRLLKSYLSISGGEVDKQIQFKNLDDDQAKQLKQTWENIVGNELEDKDLKYLVDSGLDDKIVKKISDVIVMIMSYPIIADRELISPETREKGITVRVLPATGDAGKPQEEDWDNKNIDETLTPAEMKKEVVAGKYIPENLSIDDYDNRMAIHVAATFLQPNMVYDAQETELRKQGALKDIKNIVIYIQTGESIIRGGSRFEPWHIKVMEGIRKDKSERSLPLEMVGSFILIFTIYLIVYLFGRRYVRRFAPTKIDLVFMGSLMLFMLLMLRILLFFTSAIATADPDIPRMAFTYAIPLAAGAMLVRFIINSETAVLFAVTLAAFSGIVVQGNVYFVPFTLMSSFVGSFAISRADKRSSILQAGILTGFINAIIVLSVHLINAASVIEPLSLNNIMWYELSAFINGVSCAVFILVAAPMAESVFGYTTDIKLLELANLNHPLLRELIIRAPGTYHHSHLVGIIAEAASEAVGANPLLTRVGAYYHDIGKIKKPAYFTENMAEGIQENIHDSLSPHMSALIISSHVKEGVELAKMYKLPQVILDMIPEHHGTKKIGYFYEKAKESEDPSMQKIEEKDFMYPGPKPQSRETAILMLADAAEAAVRSLKEKNPVRIQQVVESIIDKCFTEGQLNECELTLKDLNKIAKAFTRILTSIYHQRVEYPKEMIERKDDEISVFEEGRDVEGGSDGPLQ